MEKYFIDFEGCCEIEAENAKQAEDLFWQIVNNKNFFYAILQVDKQYD